MNKYFKARVEQLENKNQFVIYTSESTIFQSYDSICAINQNGKLILGRDWDYSHTTRKHLYIFIWEVCQLNREDRYKIFDALKSKNKRKAIQQLIEEGVIIYDNELR